jgi:hypothetical protein
MAELTPEPQDRFITPDLYKDRVSRVFNRLSMFVGLVAAVVALGLSSNTTDGLFIALASGLAVYGLLSITTWIVRTFTDSV